MTRWLFLGALIFAATSASADRWFGSVSASCDSFANCSATPTMPDQPADSASVYLRRGGKANAPVEIYIHVNKPVEGGVTIRFAFGQTTLELPAGDVLTRQKKGDRIAGYWIAEGRVAEVLAALRKVDTARMSIAVAGQEQSLLVMLDGLDNALRFIDERQGRGGAQDALIDRGDRSPADAAAPKPLPAHDAWPKEIVRIFTREKCEGVTTFAELAAGFVATPAPGRELWQIACAGGNYNIHFLSIEIRNGDPKTARLLTLPTRSRPRPDSVVTNPTWWDARKELWAFERGRSAGDCGTVVRYRWTERGFTLVDERSKDDCDGRFDDPWTKWPAVKSPRKR